MILSVVIKYVLYFLLAIGVYLLLSNFLNFNRLRNIKKIKHAAPRKKLKFLQQFEEHIELLLTVLNPNTKKTDVNRFIVTLYLMFAVTLGLILTINFDVLFSLFIAVLVTSIPYIIIRLRVKYYQLTIGLLFIENFHIIYQAYNKERKMYFALVESMLKIKSKELNKIIEILVTSLSLERSEEGFKKAEKIFAYTVNNIYGFRFGKLLHREHLHGNIIDTSITNLNDDINERKAYLKEKNTKLLDSYFLGFSQPFILAFLMYLFYSFTSENNIKAYFSDKDNLYLLVIVVFMNIISFSVAYLLKKSKKID